MDRGDDWETTVVLKPEHSQLAQVDFSLQFKEWSIVFRQNVKHGKQIGGMASHRTGAQVAERWIGESLSIYPSICLSINQSI